MQMDKLPERRKREYTIPLALAGQLLAIALGYGKLSQQVADLASDLDRTRAEIVALHTEMEQLQRDFYSVDGTPRKEHR